MKQIYLGVVMYYLLGAASSPVFGQTDQHASAIAAAIERAVAERGLAADPRGGVLLDTLRSAIDSHIAIRLAEDLGVILGRSEEHCRRFISGDVRYGLGPPIGYEVHGVSAIVTVARSDFHGDSANVLVTTARGAGTHIGGPSRYSVYRGSGGWRAEQHVRASQHGSCSPQLFTAPLILAAQAILSELGAPDPLCYDPTGFFLHERDSVAIGLGAELRGRWVPLIGGETPEFARDPCERGPEQWGTVVKFLEVDWHAADALHVSVEARIPATQTTVRRRYTLSLVASEWTVKPVT